MTNPKDLFRSPEWQEAQQAMEQAQKEFEAECETAWNLLDQDTKLKIFCAVCTRLYKGELEDKGSYRHILYDVFGFGTEAYSAAQGAGFLALHNSILDDEQKVKATEKLLKLSEEYNIPKEKIRDLFDWEIIHLMTLDK